MNRFDWLIWRWLSSLGKIPRWVRWLYPYAHWCIEMDDLLITKNYEDCFCGVVPDEKKEKQVYRCDKCDRVLKDDDTLHEMANGDYVCTDCYSGYIDYVHDYIKGD